MEVQFSKKQTALEVERNGMLFFCQYRNYLMVHMEFTPCLQICHSICLASSLHVILQNSEGLGLV